MVPLGVNNAQDVIRLGRPGHETGQRSSGSRPRVSGISQNSTMTSAAGRKVTSPATSNRWPTLATSPKTTRPVTAPSTPVASDQPATDARTDVGNSSLTSEPAAGAKTELANTPRMYPTSSAGAEPV